MDRRDVRWGTCTSCSHELHPFRIAINPNIIIKNAKTNYSYVKAANHKFWHTGGTHTPECP